MNKNLLLLIFLGSLAGPGTAQICAPGDAAIALHGNSVRALLRNNGNLFHNAADAGYFPGYDPTLNNPATIFIAGLWIGGIDPGGNLQLAGTDYESTATPADYWPGPLDTDGLTDETTCANWDRHFQVEGSEIASFLNALPTLTLGQAITAYPSILGWPGRGNPHFASIQGFDLPFTAQQLAPFFDSNGNGNYEPMQGDYPVVKLQGIPAFVPGEIVWTVFNDQGGGQVHSITNGKAFRYEIQLTAWAFNCANSAALNNTVFTAHKMIYRGQEPIDSTYVGFWVDFDIGCYLDDYVGSFPAQNAFYAYNSDAVDNMPCSGTASFGDAPPVQSVTLLNQSLDHFVYMANASVGSYPAALSDPSQPLEYYNYLTGRFRDGTPITAAGNGYQNPGPQVSHAFAGDPASPGVWTACTANIPSGDFRGIGTHRLGTVAPGQISELVTAWAYHPNPPLPCNLGTTSADIATLQAHYDAGFSGACSPLSAAPELPRGTFKLWPNPAGNRAVLEYEGLEVSSLSIADVNGHTVLQQQQPPVGRFELDTRELPSGLYFVELRAGAAAWRQKLVVLRSAN